MPATASEVGGLGAIEGISPSPDPDPDQDPDPDPDPDPDRPAQRRRPPTNPAEGAMPPPHADR